jgi:hypothetical protein
VRVLGVDTASDRKDRGYAIVENRDGGPPRLVWTGVKPPGPEHGPIDVVAGERPWQAATGRSAGTWGRGGRRERPTKGKLTGDRLITFCVNNGFQLRDAWPWTPTTFVLLPVLTWKDAAIPGCSRMQGDAFCKNLAQLYAPGEENHNRLDAIGIAVAAVKIGQLGLSKYVPKGFLR